MSVVVDRKDLLRCECHAALEENVPIETTRRFLDCHAESTLTKSLEFSSSLIH